MTTFGTIGRAALVATLLVSATPLMLGGHAMPGAGFSAVYAKDNGKAKGKSSSSNKSSKSSSSSKAFGSNKSSNASSSGGSRNSAAKKENQTQLASSETNETTETTQTKTQKALGKEKNIHAVLAGLNSLNRNINGLMNSSDPRMEGLREYMEAYAGIADAEAALETAGTDLTNAQAALDALVSSYGLTSYDGSYDYSAATLDDLSTRLDELNTLLESDPDNADLQAEQQALSDALAGIAASQELADVATAQETYNGANATLSELMDATTDEALKAALMVAANEKRIEEYGDGYITPEMLDWAKQALGITEDAAPETTDTAEADPVEPTTTE